MSSIKGTFQNGVVRPLEPVSEIYEGREVTITFADDEPDASVPAMNGTTREGWDALTELLAGCAVDAGAPDLAHEHDHYLYGKPKNCALVSNLSTPSFTQTDG